MTPVFNPDSDLTGYMGQLGLQARKAAAALRLATSEQKTRKPMP